MNNIKRISRRQYNPPEGHTKYLNSTNIYVPSTTTILKIIAKDALIGWANHLGWKRKNVKDELTRASTIGTITHMLIEDVVNGREPNISCLDMYSWDVYEGVHNAFTSFQLWWKRNKHRVEIIQTELQMANDMFGGTADLICKLDGKLTVLDFKTSSSIYYSMFLQLASYSILYTDTCGDIVENVAILRMDKKNGEEAELMDINDVILKAGLDIDPIGMIGIYKEAYLAAVELYYHLYDIASEWRTKI